MKGAVRIMKRIFAFAAVAVMVFAVAGCDLLNSYSDRYVPNQSASDDGPLTHLVHKLDLDIDVEPDAEGNPPELPNASAAMPEPSGLERDEYGILIGSLVFDEPVLLVGAYDAINVRSGPDIESERVASLGLGQMAEATEVVDGWYRVTVLPGMYAGFVRSDLLMDYSENIQYFASPRVDYIVRPGSGSDDEDRIVMENTLVDVRTVIPDIDYYMIFATPYNFTGSTLYLRDIPILQSKTAEKLKAAQELFREDGYGIKIYDAYRPSSVSGILFSIVGDPSYIAPAGTSVHNRAAAIDMTLVDEDGNELEMPSPIHTLDRTSNRDYPGMSAEGRKNMDYMASIMRRCGFTTVSTEWWHFSDTEIGNYPPLDFSFSEFLMYAVEK